MTLDAWIDSHPYLRPLADLHVRLHTTTRCASPVPADARWAAYAPEFATGVPLLQSDAAGLDLDAVSTHIRTAIENLARGAVDDELAAKAHALALELRAPGAPQPMDWLLGGVRDWIPSDPGLLRCAGWVAAQSALQPLLIAFDCWRNEDRWFRRHCPTCGSLPAMAQLAGKDPGRRRLMSCGCCRTRWQYARTGCPFCETESHRLAAVGVEGARGLRIDYCETCHGYLKTYDGEGDEPVMLADWTSLHIDVLAMDRGFKRFAPSLYDLGALGSPDSATPEAVRVSGGATRTGAPARRLKLSLTQ